MSKKEIFINGRFLAQGVTGVQRVARSLIKEIDHLIANGEINVSSYKLTLLIPANATDIPEYLVIETRRVGFLVGHPWEQFELPWYSRGGVLVSLCNTGPVVKRSHLVFIHDAAVFSAPAGYSVAFLLWYRVLFRVLVKTSAHVITVSEFSRQELMANLGVNKDKVSVVYNGVDHIEEVESDYSLIAELNLSERPFVLAVGSANPNKNIRVFLKALGSMSDRNFDVVIVGESNSKVFAKEYNSSASVEEMRLYRVGRVSDGQLKALYERASCFVFPSIYEGFGIPPLEAMAFGCPVIASNAASIPEVCGHAAMYFDPNNHQELVQKLLEIVNNQEVSDKLRRNGRKQYRRYTWNASATSFWGILETISKSCSQ